MTATATLTYNHTDAFVPSSPFTFHSSPSDLGPDRLSFTKDRGFSDGYLSVTGGAGRLKRRADNRDSSQTSMTKMIHQQELHENVDARNTATTTTTSSWHKRLSAFSSNESSIGSATRPLSATLSHSNGSVAFSNAGSSTPIFPSLSPGPPLPNKLVKRTSSVRSTKGSSRIPLPMFKKPATSHERDATLQNLQRRPSTATSSDPIDHRPERLTTYRSVFTPRLTLQSLTESSRRNSTSIPNPIKRIIPGRKHSPMLVSACEDIRPASLCFEQASQEDDSPRSYLARQPSVSVARRFFSSPLPQRPTTPSSSATMSLRPQSKGDDLKSETSSKRNSIFSLSKLDQLTSSPPPALTTFTSTPVTVSNLPKWKRPSKLRGPEAKHRRKGVRHVSEPQPHMEITTIDHARGTEPPKKRRDTSGKSHHSSASSGGGSTTPSKFLPLHESPDQSLPSSKQGAFQAFASLADESQSRLENGLAEGPHFTAVSDSAAYRATRLSGVPSDFASSFAESDYDGQLFDVDGFDSMVGTPFDSVRTRATSAGSAGFKTSQLDRMFDPAGSTVSSGTPVPSEHALQHIRMSRDTFDGLRHSTIEEEDGVATPVRSAFQNSLRLSPDVKYAGSPSSAIFASSPPEVPVLLRRLPSDDGSKFDDDDDWDFSEAGIDSSRSPKRLDLSRLHPNLSFSGPTQPQTPLKQSQEVLPDARSNIFDWSEHTKENVVAGASPPRPRTVHGKKDADTRGSRSVGRRAPSAHHMRSQSVPVVAETESKRSQVVTNKFGTWGVGSKGVTEDWNEDFDFEEMAPPVPTSDMKQRAVSTGMTVPKAIQERQNNVLANIDLLRDWGMLIEELKDLRLRAQQFDLRTDTPAVLWHEVDAMIDLADQESNDHTLAPRQSPPSSPSFDYGAFEEPMHVRNSPRPNSRVHASDIFDAPAQPVGRASQTNTDLPSARRPRKDSEAVARSVIEALQQKRNVADPAEPADAAPKKVPFDTTTLRRLVPYVQDLRDKIKRAIRDAEHLYNSPELDKDEEPRFSRIFHTVNGPVPSSNGSHRTPTQRADNMMEDRSSRSPPDDLARCMTLMTVG